MPAFRPTSRHSLLILLVMVLVLQAPIASRAQGTTEASVGAVKVVAAADSTMDAATFANTASAAITQAWPQFTALFATEPERAITITLVGTIDPATVNGWHWINDLAWMSPDGTNAMIATGGYSGLTDIEAANVLRNILARAFMQQAGAGHVPPGLAAGLARYLETPIVATQARLGSLVQGLDQAGTLPSWPEIVANEPEALSAEERAANGYALVAFLAERYGVLGLRTLVTSYATSSDLETNLNASFGQSTAALTGPWETFLPRWFASGWRENAASAFDISRAESLFARGAYEAATAEAERSQRLFTDIGDTAGLSRVEALLAQCAVGLQADGLMLQTERALNDHDYGNAMTYLLQAEALYDVLPPEHRPATSIDRYRTLATTGLDADAQLAAAQESGNGWFTAAQARGDALAAGDAYASLGDEEGRTEAAALVQTIDTRIWRMVYLMSAIVVGLAGWLIAWAWLRHPARLHWPSPRNASVPHLKAR